MHLAINCWPESCICDENPRKLIRIPQFTLLKRFDNRPENALRLDSAGVLKARTKECVGSRLVYICKPKVKAGHLIPIAGNPTSLHR